MDKGFEKEEFETLKIKSSVAIEFRKFSKMLSKSQSMTLLLMMEFFNANGISPAEHLGPRMETLENRISFTVFVSSLSIILFICCYLVVVIKIIRCFRF